MTGMSKVEVLYSQDLDEYRVPSIKGHDDEAGACYTTDGDDALATARHIHGHQVEIKFLTLTCYCQHTRRCYCDERL